MLNDRVAQSPDGETGATAVEYGLIVFAVAAVIALVVFAFGVVTQETHGNACDAIRQGIQNQDC